MKVVGASGIVVDVPESVGRSMVAAGHVDEVVDRAEMDVHEETVDVHEEPVKPKRTRQVKDSVSF